MQQAIARHNMRASEALSIRIGISLGEVVEDDGDYFGDAVIEAARPGTERPPPIAPAAGVRSTLDQTLGAGSMGPMASAFRRRRTMKMRHSPAASADRPMANSVLSVAPVKASGPPVPIGAPIVDEGGVVATVLGAAGVTAVRSTGIVSPLAEVETTVPVVPLLVDVVAGADGQVALAVPLKAA
jgi:hypothetical protein